ncbi:MAG: hypothetical protein ACM3YN_03955 [Parcubacteria group bacterium]
MRGPLAALTLALALGACSPGLNGVDESALQDAVSRAIGDPATCVLLVDHSGKTLWRYGTHMTCARDLPACAKAGETQTIEDVARRAAKGEEAAISCPSSPDGLRTVGWASGPVQSSPKAKHPPLFFAAVMEGERALPGREITARLTDAFTQAGL